MEVAGQESVVLAAKVEKLGQSCGINFSELSFLSCARQVVCAVRTRTLITSRCNEPCRNWCIHPIFVSHQRTDYFKVVRLVTCPLNGSEARGDVGLIQTLLLLL